MKRHWLNPSVLLMALLVVLAGCYELTSTTTLLSSTRSWTGTGVVTTTLRTFRRTVGLSGSNLVLFRGSGLDVEITSPAMSVFGGAHTLTSITQTHGVAFHGHTFAYGNLVGRTDSLDLLYTTDLYQFGRVSPAYLRFYEGGRYYNVVQVCELAAATLDEAGTPSSPDSHLFASMRACPEGGGACVGGVLEVAVDLYVTQWWIRTTQFGNQVTIRKADGTTFSSECMPIAVTGFGDQARQYLVVGDPSWDELSVFDAERLYDGALDAVRVPDSARTIADVVVEGRRDGTVDYVMAAVLWRGTGAAIEHSAIVNGDIGATPHLVESMPSDVQFIEGAGAGAEASTGVLHTFGNRVIQRAYTAE